MGGPYACGVLIACALLAASGNRLKPGLQEQLGPDLNVKWRKGAAFICLQKWERKGEKFTDQFCLADLQEVLDAEAKILQARAAGKPAGKMRVAKKLAKCQAKRAAHLLKVCDLKGKQFSYRLSYSDRAHVPKICFSKSARVHLAQDSFPIELVQSAVQWKTCTKLGEMPEPAQNAFLEAVNESSSTTTTSLEIEDFVKDISIEEESSTTTTTTTTTIAIVASLSTSTSTTTTTTSTTVSLDLVSQILRDNEDGIDNDAGTLVSIRDEGSDSVEVEDDTAGVDIDKFNFQQLRDLWRKREQRALANPAGEKRRI
eukprot:CAMPEP_0169100844 /NCGR_PEP_ID=MMETSP1015-20121227/21309_1 /TAXON_ID=342587 /ORGANISM="Karlodinium micrum, Strain CCMP2283" /LENGTH=313 /DNA_ID=CAMNT_0009161823 /DNA_START=58 /DNA_END=999 /DNA_ORIENTATION=+